MALNKLDHKAKYPSEIFAYTFDTIAAMVLGSGICLSMEVIGDCTQMSFIAGIAIAAYTTYKIIFAVIHYLKTRGQNNLSLYGLKIINLMDAIVSILTLQNTMVTVFGSESSMQTLTAYTSAGILMLMFGIAIVQIQKGTKLNPER